MATEAPSKAKQTWRDWLPDGATEPDELLTRDELIEQLRGEGFVVDRDDFRNWQSSGAIPYGINRRHNGATRTLYPGWMLDVVRTLRAMQADGRKLAEIRAHLRDRFDRRRSAMMAAGVGQAAARGEAATLGGGATIYGSASVVATATATAKATHVRSADASAVRATEVTAVERLPASPVDLGDRLVALARDAERASGGRIVRAEVRLIDEEGLPLVFRFDTRPSQDA